MAEYTSSQRFEYREAFSFLKEKENSRYSLVCGYFLADLPACYVIKLREGADEKI